jgi:tetratricopeptide (TPR) repeat protein
MRRRVLISHFYNEAYLLPWWLEHHTRLFDHGVLIDYHSTDASVEICRRLAPNWEVRTSVNSHFDAIACDQEVMAIEREFPDAWKLALNTTEFFCPRDPEGFFWSLEQHGWMMYALRGVILVDPPDAGYSDPATDRPLVSQRWHGYFEDEQRILGQRAITRSRLMHRDKDGRYLIGRHSAATLCYMHPPGALLLYFLHSPWNEAFLQRKMQIALRIPESDRRKGIGNQHLMPREELNNLRSAEAQRSQDLRLRRDFQSVMAGWELAQALDEPSRNTVAVSGFLYDGPYLEPYAMAVAMIHEYMPGINPFQLKILDELCLNQLDRHPGDSRFMTIMALGKVVAEDFNHAVLLFRQAIRWNPDDANAQYNLSVLLRSQHQEDEAEHHLRRARALNRKVIELDGRNFALV